LTKKNSKKKIIKILYPITGLGKSRSEYICRKFGYQEKSILLDLDILEIDRKIKSLYRT
jgi:ribosomal protein S13